jgi:CrcB protein
MTLFYVGIGGALGSILRYLTITLSGKIFGVTFPYGTITVNIVGSCLMGVLAGYLARTLPHSMDLRAFLAVGVLGGFTTFSAFSLDTVTLLDRGEIAHAAIYVVFSVLLSIVALFAGLAAVRVLG